MNNYRSSNYSSSLKYGRNVRNPYIRQPQSPLSQDLHTTQNPISTDSVQINSDDLIESSCISNECSINNKECNKFDKYCEYKPMHHDQLYGLPLAMAYVPWQEWSKPLPACEGFKHGTIFEDLILPFLGDKKCMGIQPRGGKR